MARSVLVVVARGGQIPRVGGAAFAPVNEVKHFRLQLLRQQREALRTRQLDVLRDKGQTACLQRVCIEAIRYAQHTYYAVSVNHRYQRLLTNLLRKLIELMSRE